MLVQHKDWYTSTDVGVRIENSNGPVVTADEVAVEITGTQAHKSFKSLTDAIEEKVDVGTAVTSVEYDSTNKKIVVYKETTPTDVVTVSTIKTDLQLAKGDVGLGNVDNTSDTDKPISTATQTALNAKVAQTEFDVHVNDTDNPHQVTASQLGLGNVNNTADVDKDVNSAIKDGDGNVITETYETIAQAGASHTTLQGNIDAVSAIVQNLTGLEGTNFGGFSLDAVEATAISNIATIYTSAGYTSGDLYWFLAGTDMSALKAYRYDGSGSPVAISSTVYDFTDFSGLSDKVQDYKGTITTLTALDALNTAASAGIYYIKTSQFNGIVLVESFYDGLATTVSQQLIGSGTPVSSGGAYTVEKGQTLARRTYSGSAWSEWSNPIASMQSQIDQLGPEIFQSETTENVPRTGRESALYVYGGTIRAAAASFHLAYYTAETNCSVHVETTAGSGSTGCVFVVDDVASLVVGYAPTLLAPNLAKDNSNSLDVSLSAGQSVVVSVHEASTLRFDVTVQYNKIDRIQETKKSYDELGYNTDGFVQQRTINLALKEAAEQFEEIDFLSHNEGELNYFPSGGKIGTIESSWKCFLLHLEEGFYDVYNYYTNQASFDVFFGLSSASDFVSGGNIANRILKGTDAGKHRMYLADGYYVATGYFLSTVSRPQVCIRKLTTEGNQKLLTDIIPLNYAARTDGTIATGSAFLGYKIDLSGLYEKGYRYICFKGSNYNLNYPVVGGLILDSNDNIESYTPTTEANHTEWYYLEITSNSAYLHASYITASDWGDTPWSPTHAWALKSMPEQNEEERLTAVENKLASMSIVSYMPSKIYGVVGYTMQIFKRGVVCMNNPYLYYHKFYAPLGKVFERYIEMTPSSAGDYTITHNLVDNNNHALTEQISTNLRVCVVPSSPSSAINVLCVGASTTENGEWATELKRMLTETTSVDYLGNPAPQGLGLGNINFVGRKTARGTKLEATGGWTWGGFTSAGIRAIRFQVSGVNSIAVGSRYHFAGVNGGTGTLAVEEVNVTGSSGNIRCTYYYNTATTENPTASGTLTLAAGQGSDSSIEYSSMSVEDFSPFWDTTNNKVTFIDYANDYCDGKIDVVITYLSPFNNGVMGDASLDSVITSAKKFLDALHTDFPNCKVLMIPSLGCNTKYGLEYNYSAASVYNLSGAQRMSFRWLKAVEEICQSDTYSSFCNMVNSYAEVDQENGFPTGTKPINSRSSETEVIGINGVHPNANGYMMLADSVFRAFCNEILS